MRSLNIRDLVLVASFSALIAVGAFIRIPFYFVPFTMQFFFVMLSGLLLGAKLGSLSVLLYIALGLIGVPVFSGGAGIGYVLKPSFGYIIGFYFATLFIGSFSNLKLSYYRRFFVNVIGLLIVDLLGVIYWYVLANYVIAAPVDISNVMWYGMIIFLPKDLVFCALVLILSQRVKFALQFSE